MTLEITINGMPLPCWLKRSELVANQRHKRRFFVQDDYRDFERYCLDKAELERFVKSESKNEDRINELCKRIAKFESKHNIQYDVF